MKEEKEVEFYDTGKKMEFYDIAVVLLSLLEKNLISIHEKSLNQIACLFSELLISEVDFEKFTISNAKKDLEIFYIQIGRMGKKKKPNFALEVFVKIIIENDSKKIIFTVYDSREKNLKQSLSLNEFDSINIWDEKIKDFFKEILVLKKNKKAVT